MTTRTLAVVSGGLSNPSATCLLADRLSAATIDALRSRGDGATVAVVDLRTHARDLADNLVTGFPDESLRTAVETVSGRRPDGRLRGLGGLGRRPRGRPGPGGPRRAGCG